MKTLFDFSLKKIRNYVLIDFSNKIKWFKKRVLIDYVITSNQLIEYDLIVFAFHKPQDHL